MHSLIASLHCSSLKFKDSHKHLLSNYVIITKKVAIVIKGVNECENILSLYSKFS